MRAEDVRARVCPPEGGRGGLQRTAALHNEVYDRIVMLSRLGSELKLAADNPSSRMLQETKQLFEKGEYQAALVVAGQCSQAMEEVGAEFLAPRAVEEARGMVSVILQLGLPAFRFEGEVRDANALVTGRRYFDGLTKAKQAVQEMTDTAREQIAREIADVRTALSEAESRREPGRDHHRPGGRLAGRASILRRAEGGPLRLRRGLASEGAAGHGGGGAGCGG